MTTAPRPNTGHPPSLQRLLAIDKTYDSLDARLDEADCIRRAYHAAHTNNYGREEFLLKWTIGKLQASPEARTSVKAWRLLYDVIQSCPVWISLADVKEVLLLGLTEGFSDDVLQSSLKTLGKAQKTIGPVTLAGKKRKRSDHEGRTDTSTDSHDYDHRTSLFVVIMEVVASLLGRSATPEHDDVADLRYRLDGLLAFELDSCLKFVKHSLIAMLHVVVAGLAGKQQLDKTLIGRAVSSIQDVWDAQKLISRSDTASSVKLFAAECLPVASLFMTVISRDGLKHIGKDDLDFDDVREILQTLIDRQCFKPARSLYHAQRQAGGKSNLSTTNGTDLDIQQVLASVRDLERIEFSQHKRPFHIWSHETLIALLDLALHRAPLATVVQRRHEQEWVDALFMAMLPQHDTLDDHRATLLTVKSMLARITAYRIVLSRSVLEKVIARYTPTATPEELSASQSSIEHLAGEILIMDPTLFTDADSPYIDVLLGALAKRSGTDDVPQHNARCDEIMVPLIQNFARARRLMPFLTLWQTFLSRGFATPARHDLWLLWTDNRTQKALIDALESSLNVEQIEGTIRSISTSLAVLDNSGKPDETTQRQIEASIVLLEAVVGATTSDAVIEELQSVFKDLIDTLIAHCELLLHEFDDELSASFLSVLARLYRRSWTITGDDQSVRSILDSKAMQVSQKTLSRASKHADCHVGKALNFVLLVCDIAARNREAKEAVQRTVAKMWIDTKSWSDEDIVSNAPRLTVDQLSGHAKSLANRRPVMLAQALLGTRSLWPYCTSSHIATLASTLRSVDETKLGPKESQSMTARLISTWSEHAGSREGPSLLRKDLAARSQAYKRLLDPEKADAIEIEKFLAHELGAVGRKISGSLTMAELDTLWMLASRLDSLFSGSSHDWVDDRACFDLFSTRCRDVLSKRKGDSTAQTTLKSFYQGHLSYFVNRKQLQGASFQLRLWMLAQQAAGLVGVEQLEYIRPAVQRDFDSPPESNGEASPHSIALLRVEAILPEDLWSVQDDLTTVSDAVLTHVHLFAQECISTSLSCSLLYRLDQDTICRMLERYIHVAPHNLFDSCASLLAKDLGPRIVAGLEDTIVDLVRAQPHINLISSVGSKLDATWLAQDYHMLRLTLGPLKKSSFTNDDQAIMHSILPTLLAQWTACPDWAPSSKELLLCIDLVLREKPFLVTQSSIESLLLNIHRTASPSNFHQDRHDEQQTSAGSKPASQSQSLAQPRYPLPATEIYRFLTKSIHSLLQFHRKSLTGRTHLLIPVLIQLLACLFTPHDDSDAKVLRRPGWLANTRLTSVDGRAYSRLLELFCDPPNSTVSSGGSGSGSGVGGGRKSARSDGGAGAGTGAAVRNGLVDETRRARVYVSQHVHSLLFAFCRFQLHGRLDEGSGAGGAGVGGRGTATAGVKEALAPGFAAVMEVLDMDGSSRRGAERDVRVRALGASMNKSELALLRREWEAWKVRGAWKG